MNTDTGKKSFYITTPIYYPNANLHLGHAYTTTICDALARYHRLIGEPTYFLTGTDDNASKVAKVAKEENKDPFEFVKGKGENFKNLYKKLNISYDSFIQTSDKDVHWGGAIEMWNKLVESGDIYKKTYSGLYCVGCENFVTEKELVDGKCVHHDTEPETVEEENYFFKLSKYEKELEEKISNDDIKIVPQTRKNEILSLIKTGLEDVSFSRPRKKVSGWGIPVPNDEDQIMYVWCDALVNYLSALGYGTKDDKTFKTFWPATAHVVGKDILRFHAAIWPAMLLSAGLDTPQTVVAHGFINVSGKKMSKTIGNVIQPENIIDEYGTDALRYYLLSEISPFEDSDFTMEKFTEAYNANLANGIGNLTNRVLKMAETHLDSPVDTLEPVFDKEYQAAFAEYNMQKASDFVWKQIRDLDQMIQEKEPFKLVKEDKEAAQKIITELVQGLYCVAVYLTPLLPDTAEKIKEAVKNNKKPDGIFERKD